MAKSRRVKLKINYKYTTDDGTFLVVEQLIAYICIFIPFFLYLADDQDGFRKSISAYVEMDNSYIFGFLLGIAAMLFIFNGALYFKTIATDNPYKKRRGKWYNIILGVALMGVVLIPYNGSLSWLHYVFAILFFGGSGVVIFFFQHPNHQIIGKIMAVVSMFSLGYCVYDDYEHLNLFWAEWIALIIIGIHYILESKEILSLVRRPK